MKTLIAATAAALALAAAAPSHAETALNGRNFNGLTLNGLTLNGQSHAGIAVCEPSPIQVCTAGLRAIVLPNGERVALR